jgi:DNA-binding beta-propeller fold protein YncE
MLLPRHPCRRSPGRRLPTGDQLAVRSRRSEIANDVHSGLADGPDHAGSCDVYAIVGNSVVPISTATNTAGKPITSAIGPKDIVISPNGKEAYVLSQCYKINGVWHGTITPISTRTNQAGAFIPAGHYPIALAISGDGKTLNVADDPASTVTAVSTATNKAHSPIPVIIGAPMTCAGPGIAPRHQAQ